MKILKGFLFTVLALVVVFVAVGYFLPKDYDMERSIVIDATPERIHAYVGDLEQWDKWMPWKEADPSIEVKLGEKTKGVGAHQSWTGKDGKGELTFTASDPDKGIEYDMAFIMDEDTRAESHCVTSYEKVEGGTKVTWAMKGTMPGAVLGGWFAMLMDSMAGKDFDKGLSKLKALAEHKK